MVEYTCTSSQAEVMESKYESRSRARRTKSGEKNLQILESTKPKPNKHKKPHKQTTTKTEDREKMPNPEVVETRELENGWGAGKAAEW